MQKVLITGSEGFVGQHLVPLMKKDYFIIGVSRREKLAPDGNSKYYTGDILDEDFIHGLLEKYKPEVIIHLAAIATSWSEEVRKLYEVNFLGTLNIFENVLKVKLGDNYDPRILYVSTADVYGKTKNPANITEESPFFPVNYYAVSKVAADRLSFQYSQTKNLKVVIARPFNHTGPGQKKGFFVPDMVSQIVDIEKSTQESGQIEVGNLESVKDFTDVRDIIKAYKLLIESDFEIGEAYNVCSGRGIKFQDLLSQLINLSEKEIHIKKDTQRLRPLDIPILIGNNQKLKSLTGWEAEIGIEKTIEDTLNYWRSL